MEVIDAEWIKARLTGARGEQARLAESMGIGEDMLSKILRGKRRVQVREVPGVLAFFDEEDGSGSEITEVERVSQAPVGHDLVPIYDVQVQAGPGAIDDDYETIASQLAFPPDYLRHITSTDPKHLAIINVIGGSMLPRLNPGDIVMVDSTIDNIARGGMWVVRHEGLIKVKRLRWGESKRTIRLISDNTTEYPEEERPADEVDVIGRVIWVGAKQP